MPAKAPVPPDLLRIPLSFPGSHLSPEQSDHMLLLDSCLEEAHSELRRCSLRQGKRGATLRQYHTCQQILQRELGIQPPPALQHLHERLTAQ